MFRLFCDCPGARSEENCWSELCVEQWQYVFQCAEVASELWSVVCEGCATAVDAALDLICIGSSPWAMTARVQVLPVRLVGLVMFWVLVKCSLSPWVLAVVTMSLSIFRDVWECWMSSTSPAKRRFVKAHEFG